MRINPNDEAPGSNAAPPVQAKTRAGAPRDRADLSSSARLTETVNAIPVVRTDRVARARELLKDPGYPDDTTLRRVANLISDHLEDGPQKSGD